MPLMKADMSHVYNLCMAEGANRPVSASRRSATTNGSYNVAH